AGAGRLGRDGVRARLATINLASSDGLRDYALLLVALTTGRRVSELAGMRREHLRIGPRTVEIVWPRCKGGKTMRDTLPRGGARGEAADALVAWVTYLASEPALGGTGRGPGGPARGPTAAGGAGGDPRDATGAPPPRSGRGRT